MPSQLSSKERCGSRRHTAVLEVMTEAETGVMQPQAEVPGSWGRRGRTLPCGLRSGCDCLRLGLGPTEQMRNVRPPEVSISVILSHRE